MFFRQQWSPRSSSRRPLPPENLNQSQDDQVLPVKEKVVSSLTFSITSSVNFVISMYLYLDLILL